MRRIQLEHVIRAAGQIAQTDTLFIFGSQSILGQYPEVGESHQINAPDHPAHILARSMEVDLCVPNHPEKTDEIEGSIGEMSIFHETFGYYAQAVDETTCKLPLNWQERLVEISSKNTRYVKGLCLEIHDLLIAKWAAYRPKDIEFCSAAIRLGLARKEVLLERLQQTSLTAERSHVIEQTIRRLFDEPTNAR
jgi:hypothetical protein